MDAATVTVAPTPACMTEEEAQSWREANGWLYPHTRALRVCEDCTLEHRRTMSCAGLCDLGESLRLCSGCRQMRPASQFNRDRTRVGGLDYVCKGCRRARRAA